MTCCFNNFKPTAMAMLSALIGLCLVVGSASIQGAAEDVSTGMPPFVFLSPPNFKAGHMVSFCETLLFTQFLLQDDHNF